MITDLVSIALGLGKYIGPKVAQWLGGDKAEEAAKEIIGIAEEVTGKKGTEMEKALAADPNLAFEYQKRVMAHEKLLDKYYLEDRQHARDRDVNLRKLGYKNIRADIMLVLVAIVICLIITLLATQELAESVITIFNMLVGGCIAMLNSAFQFEFGSSRGSKEKDFRGQ